MKQIRKIITKLEDFPTPSNGIITLEPFTDYIIVGEVDIGTNQLQLSNDVNLRGFSYGTSKLIYSGTSDMIIGSNLGVTIDSITLEAQSGNIFNITDDYSHIFFLNNVRILNTNNIGKLANFMGINLSIVKVLNTTNGISIEGNIPHVVINNYLSSDSITGYHLKIVGNIGALSIISSKFNVNTGAVGIDATAIDSIGEGSIVGCMFKGGSNGSGTYIDGISQLSNPGVMFVANYGINNNHVLGQYNTAELKGITGGLPGTMYYNKENHSIAILTSDGWKEVVVQDMYTLLFEEDFSSGYFYTNGRTVANSSTNYWIIGNDTFYDDTYSAYITNDGTANAYSNGNSVSHLYKDITLPSSSEIKLYFMWKCVGEAGYDYGAFYIIPTSITPTADTELDSSYKVGGNYLNNSNWKEEVINLTSYAGQTIRIVFSWKNDGSVVHQPPLAIDNIIIKYL